MALADWLAHVLDSGEPQMSIEGRGPRDYQAAESACRIVGMNRTIRVHDALGGTVGLDEHFELTVLAGPARLVQWVGPPIKVEVEPGGWGIIVEPDGPRWLLFGPHFLVRA